MNNYEQIEDQIRESQKSPHLNMFSDENDKYDHSVKMHNRRRRTGMMHAMGDMNTRNLLSDTKFFESYSRFDHEKERYETFEESVARVMQMHRE